MGAAVEEPTSEMPRIGGAFAILLLTIIAMSVAQLIRCSTSRFGSLVSCAQGEAKTAVVVGAIALVLVAWGGDRVPARVAKASASEGADAVGTGR
jgi:hypothetical protein